MAFNESPRFRPLPSQTSEFLGPNFYFISDNRETRKNSVGFLSQKERGNCFQSPVWTSAIYYPKICRRVIGGSSMRNRSKRVTFDLPKPPVMSASVASAYDPVTGEPKCVKEPRKPRKLYVCRVPYSVDPRGPSVPSRIDENGYSYDANGKFVKNPPDITDVSMGPAYYCINTCPNITKEMYGGCRWSASRSQRKTIEILNDNPGPGTYNLSKGVSKCLDAGGDQFREMARMFSFLPRELEAIQQRTIREDLPGPASYNLQRPFIEKSPKNKYSAFNSSEERRHELKLMDPGPADYHLQDTLQVKRVSRKKGKFTFNAPRFRRKHIMKCPGPADYEIARYPPKDKYLRYKTVPFFSSVERSELSISELPASNVYNVIPKTTTCTITNVSSVFKSKGPRLADVNHNPFQKAHAGSYNISTSFNQVQNQKSFLKKEVGFLTTAKRPKFFSSEPKPGPYLGHEIMPYKGFVIPDNSRDRNFDQDVPGAGTYNLVTEEEIAMSKSFKTFNIKLRENVLRTKLRLPTSKTRDQWNRERVKRKQLKVFKRDVEITESLIEAQLGRSFDEHDKRSRIFRWS